MPILPCMEAMSQIQNFCWGEIVHFVELSKGLTYCFVGAKILDIVLYIPAIIELHPSACPVFVHVGTNDVKYKQSIKLQCDMEFLALTVESLGKQCVISGPIPTLRKGCEGFSWLFSFNQWLQGLCSATSFSFLDHVDVFWNRRDLYERDHLRHNKKGTHLLTAKIVLFLYNTWPC